MRINKFISGNSKYSRRKADELIKQGKVFLNNKKIQTPGIQINPEKDTIKINNQTIKKTSKKEYLALNKPQNYITTRNDELNRKTVMSLLPKISNLKPIGRLDKDTEGLLLFSNDGEFINYLTHPKFQCEKEYLVKIKGQISNKEKQKLENGIIIDNKKTNKAKIKITKTDNSATELKIIITEGRKRQIRKMFASIGHPVKYLQRIRIGKIKLKSLAEGKYRKLTSQEIKNAYKST